MNRKEVPRHSTLKVVYAAILANLGIAISKYIAGFVTGSPAMLAEAYHSTADTGNELLLLLGLRRSTRTPDALHPFGHGKAIYFYSLLVAVFIFGVGGALAAYQGISWIRHPEPPGNPVWNYVVLGIAVAFEFYSWRIARQELHENAAEEATLWEKIRDSKDPATFTVFFEDSAALIGIGFAFFGVLLGHVFHNPYFDPAASLLIALLLSAVALLLGRESGALLLGESADPEQVKAIREVICSDSAVERVGNLLTMHLGPEQVLLAAEIKFRDGLDVQELESAIDRVEEKIRTKDPTIERIFLEADSLRPGREPVRAA